MAKKKTDSIYRIVDVVGVSEKSGRTRVGARWKLPPNHCVTFALPKSPSWT